DVDGVLQVEMGGHCREIVGVMIHIVTVGDLAGPAVAAAIMGDNAIAVLHEEQHLRVPIVGRQWPAVAKYDRLTVAPVLVEDLDPVFGGNHAHVTLSFLRVVDNETTLPSITLLCIAGNAPHGSQEEAPVLSLARGFVQTCLQIWRRRASNSQLTWSSSAKHIPCGAPLTIVNAANGPDSRSCFADLIPIAWMQERAGSLNSLEVRHLPPPSAPYR